MFLVIAMVLNQCSLSGQSIWPPWGVVVDLDQRMCIWAFVGGLHGPSTVRATQTRLGCEFQIELTIGGLVGYLIDLKGNDTSSASSNDHLFMWSFSKTLGSKS